MKAFWNPLGTVRNYFTDKSHPNEMSNKLINLQNYFLEEGLGSGILYRGIELLKTYKPDSVSEDEDIFFALLILVMQLEKAEKKGSLCVAIDVVVLEINEVLSSVDLGLSQLSTDLLKSWISPETNGWLFGTPGSIRPLIYNQALKLIYFFKSWRQEDHLRKLLESRIKMSEVQIDDDQIENALEEILEKHPVRIKGVPLELNTEQFQALITAVYSPLMILSGGPGTGKTSITVCLLRLLKRLGMAERPVLTAPTGRAAKHLSAAVSDAIHSIPELKNEDVDFKLLETADSSQTLHRLLGFHPPYGRFRTHEYAPLENDIVILDEASMVDLALMLRLLKAMDSKLPYIAPCRKLILIGDSRQLPPVNSGAPFIDLASEGTWIRHETKEKVERLLHKKMHNESLPVWNVASEIGLNSVHLRRGFRQDLNDASGINIHQVTLFIRNSKQGDTFEELFNSKTDRFMKIGTISDPNEYGFEMFNLLEQKNSPLNLSRFSQFWAHHSYGDNRFRELIEYTYSVKEIGNYQAQFDEIFNYLNRFKILCLTHVLPTGTHQINRWILEHLTPQDLKFLSNPTRVGCPVICNHNLHDLKLYNGDQGIFLNFKVEDSNKIEVKALFQVEGMYQTFYDQQLIHIEPSHAITVHKSQGSEYEHVAVILPDAEQNEMGSGSNKRFQELQNLEMLYTAITRARRSIIIVGSRQVLQKTLQRRLSLLSGLRKPFFEKNGI